MPAVLSLITAGLGLLPGLVKAGMDIADLIGLMKGAAEKGDVSDDDWTKLHGIEDALRQKLHSDQE